MPGPPQPVAVIENGCTPAQRVIIGDLATIAERCRIAELQAPAVIVVGDVVTLANPAVQDSQAPAPRSKPPA